MRVLFLIVLLCTLSCCKKENSQLDNIYSGEAFAKINGIAWKAKVNMFINPNYTNKVFINLDVYNDNKQLRESLVIGNVDTIVKSVTIEKLLADSTNRILNKNPIGNYYRLTGDGDLISDRYFCASNKPNILVINSYNESTKEVKGEFNISLARDTTVWKDERAKPDTIYFTEGRFSGKFE